MPDDTAAFRNSPSRPDEADSCGYCGEEFLRSGISSATVSGHVVTEREWKIRIKHLQTVHNFRECDEKKFFRADHFRQHLVHCHAGTSGEWTHIIEDACMKPERVSLAIDG